MSYCYLCGKKLCNEKPEHIIPNAFGGHLKSRNILCSDCNNKLSDIDRKLCSDLELLTNFISPKRENNKNTIPVIETICDGETFDRVSDGSYRKNKNNIQFDGKTLHFSFSHTPNSEAEKTDFQILQNTLRQFAKKNNKNDEWIQQQISKALNQSIINSKESGIHHFQFISNKSGYSFLGSLKIILGFCTFKKVDKKYLESAVEILKKQDISACYKIANYFNDNSQLPKNSVYHTLYLKGNTISKTLYAIVSLYGVFNIFFLLSDSYEGVEIEDSYNYDILKNTPSPHNMSYNFSLEQINRILVEDCAVTIIQQNFNQFMNFFMLRDRQNYILKKIEEVKQSVFQKLVFRNEMLTEEDYRNSFTSLFFEAMKKCHNMEFLPEGCFYDLSKIILDNIHTYDWYCYNKEMLLFMGNSVTMLYNSHPKTQDELFNLLTSYINTFRCATPEIQQMYDENKEGLTKFIIDFYRNALKNTNYKDFFLKQDSLNQK